MRISVTEHGVRVAIEPVEEAWQRSEKLCDLKKWRCKPYIDEFLYDPIEMFRWLKSRLVRLDDIGADILTRFSFAKQLAGVLKCSNYPHSALARLLSPSLCDKQTIRCLRLALLEAYDSSGK